MAVASRLELTNYYWELAPTFVADHAETFAYIADGMYHLFCIEEFPLTVRAGNHADVSLTGLFGDPLHGHEINPVSGRLRRRDVMPYFLLRTRSDRLSRARMAQVFGAHAARELREMAMESLAKSIAEAPSDRGFQILQYINIRHRQRRFANVAQVAKLSYLDIYHPMADDEVLSAALQLPPGQLMLERAYRRAMATYFPDLAVIPWTFTLTPATVSVRTVVLKKIAQLTLGKWLRGTRLGRHPLIRPRRYFVDYRLWSRAALRAFIERTLLSAEASNAALFTPDGMRQLVTDHMESRGDFTDFLGSALAVSLWSRLFYIPSRPVRPDAFGSEVRT
jgi:hypothetical protein